VPATPHAPHALAGNGGYAFWSDASLGEAPVTDPCPFCNPAPERVLAAYEERCALSGLPERHLVDAAHIVADADEALGQPDVRNGICLSKVHHAAFDAHLIGIDPSYRVHVSPQLLRLHDGPLLEQALKRLDGITITLPRHREAWPDRERLAVRFAAFRALAA